MRDFASQIYMLYTMFAFAEQALRQGKLFKTSAHYSGDIARAFIGGVQPMTTKRSTSLLIVFVLLLALSATAFAGSAHVSGTGTLTASGSGRAVLRGDGSVDASGNGVLKVLDCGGDAVIHVTGNGLKVIKQKGNCVLYKYVGFNGTASVVGDNIKVKIKGIAIDMTAHGTGVVRLNGVGVYHVGNQTGLWSEPGVEIYLSE
jgi:hypothetical protein